MEKSYHSYLFRYLKDATPPEDELLHAAGEELLAYAELSAPAKVEINDKFIPKVARALKKVLGKADN